jgi:hypothetical protein
LFAQPKSWLTSLRVAPQVMKYCHSRGFLQCFWECGGSLAAPAVVRVCFALSGGAAGAPARRRC